MFVFRQITLFCLRYRFSKQKMTIYSKNLGGMAPLGPPGYAYGHRVSLAEKYSCVVFVVS